MSSYRNYYETGTISRPSSRADNQIEPEKSTSSKLPASYRPSTYTPGSTRDRSATREPGKYGTLSSNTSVKEPEKSIREKYTAPEKPVTSVRDKYTSSSTYPSRAELTARIKTALEKKDTPPVTYRTLSRTGARSRDPSPVDREKTDNYRLYPRSYTRSSSREPDPVSTSSLKYGSKTPAASKEDLSTLTTRYGGRLSRSDIKDEVPTRLRTTSSTSLRSDSKENLYPRSRTTSMSDSKEDLTTRLRSTRSDPKDEVAPRLRSSTRSSKEDLTSSSTLPRYTSSRHTSKEDLTVPATKYINSRFLPRNTIEKSYSSYSKPITRSVSNTEEKRRNRDNLMSVLQTQASLKSTMKPRPDETSSPIPKVVLKPTLKPVVAAVKVESKQIETSSDETETETEEEEEIEMEKVTVVTRGTSPTMPTQPNYVRNRRADMARVLQKDVIRPKKRKGLVDKEMQSDRLDDTARYSRFGSSTVAAAPWSSYLDLKYNSPRTGISSAPRYSSVTYSYKSKDSGLTPPSRSERTSESRSRENSVSLDTDKSVVSENQMSTSEKGSIDRNLSEKNVVPDKSVLVERTKNNSEKASLNKSTKKSSSSSESINSISRTNSSKSINQKAKTPKSKSPSPSLSTDSSKPKTPVCSKQTSIETSTKKQLPPPVPKSETPCKSSSLNSVTTQNKDFRKSVLNMNTDGKATKKSPNRSTSVSSDSEPSSGSVVAGPETQNKLSTSQSLSKLKSTNSVSKLPQKVATKSDEKSLDKSRSPSVSSESSTTTSSSEDDLRKSQNKSVTASKKLQNIASSRTSVLLSSADELSIDRPSKPPPSPRSKTEPKTEEAKSFLMRALAPVTNFFKVRQQEMENSSDQNLEGSKKCSNTEQPRKKILIRRIESGERAWWLDENTEPPEGVQKIAMSSKDCSKIKGNISKQESGEEPWWLDENAEVPEGIQKYATNSSQIEVDDGRHIYKIQRNESGKVEWWLDNTDAINENKKSGDKSKSSVEKKTSSVERSKSSAEKSKSGAEKSQISQEKNKESSEKSKNSTEKTKTALEKTKNSTKTNLKRSTVDLETRKSSEMCGKRENNTPEGAEKSQNVSKTHRLRHQNSGDKAWWLMTNPNIPDGVKNLNSDSSDHSDSDLDKVDEPLGDRASPEGLEMPREAEKCGRLSPYDNVPSTNLQKPKRPTHIPLFISKHTNIDEILGGSHQMLSPLMDRIYEFRDKKVEEVCEEVDAGQVKIHDSTAQLPVIQPGRIDVIEGMSNTCSSIRKLDDAALQLYKDGDYGSYLDLEASISEQQEEFEGFQTNKKNSIVLRTQLSVRVHTIIEKLLTSEGRELRRALFSLKQIFQEDKDLVHEFVQNDGLACLIKVGSEADQNYQNYILRALGQVMLYVDGMNGVMEHNQTVQWLYTLIASKFRLVVKTALKLLLVFVEYTDSNCMLLIKAVKAVDGTQGLLSWSNIMRLLKDFNSADTELLIYAMTLVNKCLNGIPDQDTYYDQTDALEEQGIEGIIQRYMSKQGTDLDLLQQFQIYEAVLQHEDGEDKGMPLRHLDESIRKTLRNRKSMVDSAERRKSRRHSTGNTPVNVGTNKQKFYSLQNNTLDDEDESSSSQSSGHNDHNLNGSYKENNKVSEIGVTPALRRRRERAERQRSFIREQQESAAMLRASVGNADDQENGTYQNNLQQRISNGNLQLSRNSSRKDLTPLMNAVNKLDSSEEGILKKPWVLQMMYGKPTDDTAEINDDNADNTNENDRKMLIQLRRENTVKDLTQKLSSQNILHSPSDESKINRIGDMTGLISKAKEGLAKSKSKVDVLKNSSTENVPKAEIKKSENELRWEELVHAMNRPLNLCDMDFTDLHSEDEVDILAPAATTNGIPPPPPPFCKDIIAPPPPPIANRNPPPFPTAPMFGLNFQRNSRLCQEPSKTSTIKKNKKTVKLFWKEVRDDPIALSKLQKCGGMIWDELSPVSIDTQKLEHLFESRAKDLITKKQQEMNKNKEIIVLDHKRSNAINIGMTKLPPPRSIKTAILKMDATIMNREGIEKLLTMLPTEEERTKIQEAQAANPDLPLGSAEQFLLTLASISELPARLKLWAFKLDFENSEREIAEPLMDLKQGIELLKSNKTFRGILSTLLSIGIFLNGAEVKGFQIEYLAKVPEVKDTVHKHSLLHHLCHIVMEKFPEATDLYSEIGAITRASKIDFDELALNIQRLESDCKASWDHLKLIAKHDGSTMMKVKMSDFLADCAERIILLAIVHRRVLNRYHKFLLWLGIPLHRVADSKPNEFCRVVSEFSLEYRTTRERVLQQLEKKANHRERNKTRGKMITEVGKFRTKEDRADAELRQLLGSDISDVESLHGTLPWRRQRRDLNSTVIGVPNGNLTDDGDDEILESLVKTATKAPSTRATPRERKRTRHADRKSLRRTLKNGLSEEEKKHIAAYIKGY